MTLQRNSDTGALLMNANGSLMRECCCIRCPQCVPELAAAYDVSLSGLAGDFAVFNGTWNAAWFQDCLWFYEDGETSVVLTDLADRWAVFLTISISCTKAWRNGPFGTQSEFCEGIDAAYAEWTCSVGSCSDADSCANSAGATCVVVAA